MPSREVEEKVRVQLGALLDDVDPATGQPSAPVQQAVIGMFINVAPVLAPGFREEFVLPRLAIAVAQSQVQSLGAEHRQALQSSLFDAYSALSCCYLSSAAIADALLPGLRALQRDLNPERAKVAASILRDFEGKLDKASRERASTLPADMSSNVEVMRARMVGRFKDIKGKMDAAGNVQSLWRK